MKQVFPSIDTVGWGPTARDGVRWDRGRGHVHCPYPHSTPAPLRKAGDIKLGASYLMPIVHGFRHGVEPLDYKRLRHRLYQMLGMVWTSRYTMGDTQKTLPPYTTRKTPDQEPTDPHNTARDQHNSKQQLRPPWGSTRLHMPRNAIPAWMTLAGPDPEGGKAPQGGPPRVWQP